MKPLACYFTACLIAITSYAQNFEGEIIYQNKFKSKISGLTDEKIESMMGSSQDYYIKGDKYKSVSNGELLQWQIYDPKENKIYTKMSNNDAALWIDGGINPDTVTNITLNRKAIYILGYECDELILDCKSGTQKYYFSSKLSIDSKLYVLHKFGNWYSYVSKTNALPLKIEIDNAQFTMTSTAIEVKPQKLGIGFFQLPVGIKIDKSQ